MKKPLSILLVLLVIMLVSCESDSPSPAIERLATIKKDGELWREYFYDNAGKLTSYKTHDNAPNHYEFTYYYSETGRIDSVHKVLNGTTLNASIVYYYENDAAIEKLEYYASDFQLYNTATFTYTGSLLTNITNSDQSIAGLKYRNFEYNPQDRVSKISFDAGSPWNYTYNTDKSTEAPLAADLSDPRNQIDYPISAFTYVSYSSYESTYEFDDKNRVTKETRNYPNRIESDPDPQTEVYTYEYE